MRHETQCHLRGHETRLRTREESASQRPFELIDMPSDRGLSQRQRARGARKTAFAENREERAIKIPARICHTKMYNSWTLLGNSCLEQNPPSSRPKAGVQPWPQLPLSLRGPGPPSTA